MLASSAHAQMRSFGTASVPFTQAQITTREQWYAVAPVKRESSVCQNYTTFAPYQKITDRDALLKDVYKDGRIIIHHTGEYHGPQSGTGLPQCLQESHMMGKGWDDIGYHFVIDSRGKIYEGRPLDKIGSHAGKTLPSWNGSEKKLMDVDYDFKAIGVVLVGNFQSTEAKHDHPKPAQIKALISLIDTLSARYGVKKVGFHRNYRLPDEKNVSKEETKAQKSEEGTNCPGDLLMKALTPYFNSKTNKTCQPGSSLCSIDFEYHNDPVAENPRPNSLTERTDPKTFSCTQTSENLISQPFHSLQFHSRCEIKKNLKTKWCTPNYLVLLPKQNSICTQIPETPSLKAIRPDLKQQNISPYNKGIKNLRAD